MPIIIKADMDSEKIVELAQQYESPAILARVHGLLQKIDALMTEREIPHTYIGKTTALTNSEPFRRFHAFLKLLVNPHDNFSFLLIKDLVGLSKEEYTSIRKAAAEAGKSHFQQWSNGQDNTDWYAFFESAPEWNFLDTAMNLESLFGPTMSDYQGDTTWKGPVYAPSLVFIMEWIRNNPKGTISDYLDWLATYDIQDEVKADNEGIILATIHAAKGLEWDTVIVAGMNEGILPSSQALKNGDLEAERRLAYVAMTRAKDQLILAVRPEVEEKDGRIHEAPVSRFINEIQ